MDSDSLFNFSSETATSELKGLVAASIVVIVLDTVFAVLRCISRFQVKSMALGWDDIVLGPAYVFAIATAAIGLVLAHVQRGDYPKDFPIIDERLTPILKAVYAISQTFYAATSLPRISLLILYSRIFISRAFRISTYVVMGLVICVWISFACGSFFACHPVDWFWVPTLPGENCIDVDPFYRAFAGVSLVIDAMIILLPVKPLYDLEISRSKKLGIFCIFLTGSIGVVACCIRLSVFLKQTAFPPTPEVLGPFMTWVVIESSMYFIAACLPSLGPLFRVCTGHRQGHSGPSSSSFYRKYISKSSGGASGASDSAKKTPAIPLKSFGGNGGRGNGQIFGVGNPNESERHLVRDPESGRVSMGQSGRASSMAHGYPKRYIGDPDVRDPWGAGRVSSG